MLFAGVLSGMLGLWLGSTLLNVYCEDGVNSVLTLILVVGTIGIVIYMLFLFFKSVRLELFRPVDEPIIFDRKHKKVYRIFRTVYSGWLGLFMSWPLKYAEHEWDLVDAEHQVAVSTNGSTINRYHALMFSVRKSKDDPTVIDSFLVGNSIQLGELTVPAVWEHIRCFMEEGGPPLSPGDVLIPFKTSKTFFQCLLDSGPYGKNFGIWWREVELLLVLALIFFPILLPFFTLIGIFAWLSYKTSVPIAWPKHVCEAVNS